MSTHQQLPQSASKHSSIASSVNQSNKCDMFRAMLRDFELSEL